MEYKFNGKISLNDFILFNNYHLKTTFFIGWKQVLFWVILAVVIIMVIFNIYTGINNIIEYNNRMKNINTDVDLTSLTTISIIIHFIKEFSIIIFIALFIVLFRFLLYKNYKKYYYSNQFYLEEQYYIVTENNIEIKTESSNATLTKEKINKIVVDKNVIYIFIALNMAYIIKDNYFKNIDEYNNFMNFISEHYKK
jgi:hypothetical protein